MIGSRNRRTSSRALNAASRAPGLVMLDEPPATMVRYQSRKRAASGRSVSAVIASRGTQVAYCSRRFRGWPMARPSAWRTAISCTMPVRRSRIARCVRISRATMPTFLLCSRPLICMNERPNAEAPAPACGGWYRVSLLSTVLMSAWRETTQASSRSLRNIGSSARSRANTAWRSRPGRPSTSAVKSATSACCEPVSVCM